MSSSSGRRFGGVLSYRRIYLVERADWIDLLKMIVCSIIASVSLFVVLVSAIHMPQAPDTTAIDAGTTASREATIDLNAILVAGAAMLVCGVLTLRAGISLSSRDRERVERAYSTEVVAIKNELPEFLRRD